MAPVIVFVLARRWPNSWLRNINIPVFLNGPLFVPPGSGINYGSFVLVGSYFQYYKRRKDFAWWSKVSRVVTIVGNADRYQYNYIIAAGLDAGAAFGAVTVWLFATIPGAKLHWWGTEGYLNSTSHRVPRTARLTRTAMDFAGMSARFTLPEGASYGPDTWK